MSKAPKASSAKISGLPWWKLNFHVIGEEKQPFLIIDNFVRLPEDLLDTAKTASFSANAPYYPGIRAEVPEDYRNMMCAGLADILTKLFAYEGGAKLQECFMSVVTTAPEDLNMVQRIPHVDGGDDKKVALLHYLCDADQGGTAFYRQSSTGFETVPQDKFEVYKKAVEQDHSEMGPSAARYYDGTDGRFEKIFEIEAKMNRAVLYFGKNLHAINIVRPDPARPRLTINSFFNPLSQEVV